jgi:hypothetical protein
VSCLCGSAEHGRCCRRSQGFASVVRLGGVVVLSRLVARAVARSATTGKGRVLNDCYLVDPASSHMLVSKIKPCMSQYLL